MDRLLCAPALILEEHACEAGTTECAFVCLFGDPLIELLGEAHVNFFVFCHILIKAVKRCFFNLFELNDLTLVSFCQTNADK